MLEYFLYMHDRVTWRYPDSIVDSILEVHITSTPILARYLFFSILKVFDSSCPICHQRYLNIICTVRRKYCGQNSWMMLLFFFNTDMRVQYSVGTILPRYLIVSILDILGILPAYLHNTQSGVLWPAPSVNGTLNTSQFPKWYPTTYTW